MVRPKRNEQINLEEAIKETAWEQIAEHGAAALSLRAMARQLHITAPAIYNYFNRRDDLVTALIIDAFTSLGDSQFSALEDLAADDHAGRLRSIALAYREWAVTHPQRYQLIFGTPIPAYHAPVEQTTPAAARSLSALIQVLESASNAGELQPQRKPVLHSSLQQQLENWKTTHEGASPDVLVLALIVWSRVHGMVSLEIGNQYPAFIENPGEIFQLEVEMILDDLLI